MKMVENIEKYILRFFLACKIVNIINDQNINHLVKMDEIILIIIFDRINELIDKLVGGNIKDRFFRKKILDLKTDGM